VSKEVFVSDTGTASWWKCTCYIIKYHPIIFLIGVWCGRMRDFRVCGGILVVLKWGIGKRNMIMNRKSDLGFTAWFDSINKIKPNNTSFHKETKF